MSIYKVYNSNNTMSIYKSLTELRKAHNLTAEETKRCFYHGAHKINSNLTVLTY